VTKRDCLSDSLLMAFSSRIKNSNAKCPKRPSQNEHRKRAVQVRNSDCGARRAPQFDFRHRQALCASPCEIMPVPRLPIVFAYFTGRAL
jgi:hypothetical protein